MKFESKIKIEAYNLADDDHKGDAMRQLSCMYQQPTKYIKQSMTIEPTMVGSIVMTLEWREYLHPVADKVVNQTVDCEVIPLASEETDSGSVLLTQAKEGQIKIIERREWMDQNGTPLMFLLWQVQPKNKELKLSP